MNVYESHLISHYIKENPYVGRGIIVGMTPNGKKAVTAYFIMGRSENSRNRIFLEEKDNLMIKAFDESKVEDPSLIIYYPIRKKEEHLIVTNGDQTDTISEYIDLGKDFRDALRSRNFEPDGPNWTPRISGIIHFNNDNKFSYELSILKSGDDKGSVCNRYFFEYEPIKGLGHFIHTYVTDGNPIPTFLGEPERINIPNSIDEFTEDIWNNLNYDNKISLYVRYIDLSNGETENRLINKNI